MDLTGFEGIITVPRARGICGVRKSGAVPDDLIDDKRTVHLPRAGTEVLWFCGGRRFLHEVCYHTHASSSAVALGIRLLDVSLCASRRAAAAGARIAEGDLSH